MYKFIHLISALIRQFLLPNPYINVIDNEIYADLFNIVIGGTIIHIFAFILTGCGYQKGVDDPASGSFGYLISYCYITAIITLLGFLISNFAIFVIVYLVVYIASCILVGIVFNHNSIRL